MSPTLTHSGDNTDTPEPPARLFLQEALALGDLCERYWQDQDRRIEQREALVYAVDVDVASMHIAPERTRDEATVFSGARDVDAPMAALLGYFALMRLPGCTSEVEPGQWAEAELPPLLLLPAHADELRGVGLAIARQLRVAHDAESLRQIQHFTRLRQKISAELAKRSGRHAVEYLLGELREHASCLHELLNGGSGAEAESRRVRAIKGRLCDASTHPAFHGTDGLLTPPSMGADSPASRVLREAADRWRDRMLAGSLALSPRLLDSIGKDARALACVEVINADAVARRLNRRLVLITGTQRLLEAGRQTSAQPSHAGFPSFSAAYLRDARSLMGARLFFWPPRTEMTDTHFRVQDWMSALFPQRYQQVRPNYSGAGPQAGAPRLQVKVSSADHEVDRALYSLKKGGFGSNPNLPFPQSALDEWRSVISGSFESLSLHEEEKLSESFLADASGEESGSILLQRLTVQLTRSVQASFANLFLSTGLIGIEPLLAQHLRARGVPALRFDVDPSDIAQRIYLKLADWMFQPERPAAVDMREIYEQLTQEDHSSDYRAHVLLAFIHASSGRWVSARTFCRTALVVATLATEEGGVRRGREAAYLMAVVERRLATGEGEIDAAKAALALAIERCNSDLERADPRFSSEAFALSVTAAQLAYFSRAKLLPEGWVAKDQMQRAEALVRDAIDYFDRSQASDRPRVSLTEKFWVVRQACTNGLLVALLEALAGRSSEDVNRVAKGLMQHLSEHGLVRTLDDPLQGPGGSVVFSDDISDFVYLVAQALMGSDPLRGVARQRLSTWSLATKDRGRLPFEVQRHTAFMELLGLQGSLPAAAAASAPDDAGEHHG
jgi:hypothetical protein